MCPAPWTDSPEPCQVRLQRPWCSGLDCDGDLHIAQVELEEDYTVAPRQHPVSHPPVDAPLCPTCRHLDLSFFDPSCPGCADILKSRETRWVLHTSLVELQTKAHEDFTIKPV